MEANSIFTKFFCFFGAAFGDGCTVCTSKEREMSASVTTDMTGSAYLRERILQNPAESCLECIFWKSEGQNKQSAESLVDSEHPAVSPSCYGNLISSNSVSTLNNKQNVLAPRHQASDMKRK